MLFNSHIFWLFFGVVFLFWRSLRQRGQNLMLLAASWVYCGWWDWRCLLLIGTSVMDFYLGRAT